MTTIRKGRIISFAGHFMSGLGQLVIDEEVKGIVRKLSVIHCENAPTVRALDGCFGDVIAEGHTVNNRALAGKEVYFSTDDFGVLEGLTPVDKAPPEMVRIYERGGE